MSIKQQPQSPLKKGQKFSNQGQIEYEGKKNQYSLSKSPFMTEGQKINFESEDSQGSDISYESSIESEDDINIGQIEYFKEEMGRFFINYPELINHGILDPYDQENNDDVNSNFSPTVGFNHNQKPQTLNRNWALIADQILSEAKDSCSFLESLSHRIALYRSKIYQEDLIDVLLKEQKNIMKEIELEINLKKKQNKGIKNTMIQHTEGCENVYFSWRKKKEIENKMNLHREQNTIEKKNDFNEQTSNVKNSPRPQLLQNTNNFRDRGNNLKQKKFSNEMTKSLNKKNSDVGNLKASTLFLTSNQNASNETFLQKKNSKTFHLNEQKLDNKVSGFASLNPAINKRPASLGKSSRPIRENQLKKTVVEESQKENKNVPSCGGQTQTFWKHLVNFEPRTEAGRQLCELIRRTNSPNDELGIKKTIMQFLVRNKETVQNQIFLKSTISQKIQKLYNDDSKELLMFYPTKMTVGQPNFGQSKNDSSHNEGNRQSAMIGGGLGNNLGDFGGQGLEGGKSPIYQNMNGENEVEMGNKLFNEGEKFMHLLEDIVEGPLMKYWMMLQENKL